MSKTVEITDSNFDQFVKENENVVVDCWAAWCGPCRMLSPIIEQLAEEKTNIAFAKLDVDKNRAVSMRYGIMSIPTLLYFKNGALVDKTLGALPRQMVEARLAVFD
ncbi:thioredoxin [Candidatus Bathyarchaeota archaeon]|nr:thioredoxin [Candidatus Bathyarchaeota archaeon]MCK4703343.1 thioredoxin [Candidatus Bathyarchaeota archaeon]